MKKKLTDLMFSDKERKKINEAIFEQEPEQISPEIKERALSAIKEYNKFGKMIYREGNLVDIAKTMVEIAKFAERFTTESAGDWFDKVTIQRNMKELAKHSSDFAKIASEVQSYQDRMTTLYEDMGVILNRYFEIADMVEEPEPETRNSDSYLRNGDRARVDMNEVRRYNPTPSYIRRVRDQLQLGKGTVKIQEVGKETSVVSGADINITEIVIPTKALTKTLGRIIEAAKFDKAKMEKFIKKDKFLNAQFKTGTSLEKLFNTYVLGDSAQEKEYNKIK